MPSVATWWCGEPAALEEVVKNLHRLVIKSAFPQLRGEPIFGEDLDERGRKRVIHAARAPERLRGAGAGAPVAGAGVGPGAPAAPAALHGPADLRLREPERLRGHARWPRPRGERRRHARDLHAARGQQQGPWVLASGPVSTFSLLRRSIGPQDWCARAPISRAGWSRTCSGSAATASAATRPRGSCASPWAGSATTFPATTTSARPVVLELLRHASILPAAGAEPGDKGSRPRCAPSVTNRTPASQATCGN